jgi:hypothetical protein
MSREHSEKAGRGFFFPDGRRCKAVRPQWVDRTHPNLGLKPVESKGVAGIVSSNRGIDARQSSSMASVPY